MKSKSILNKLKIILFAAFVIALCVGLAACKGTGMFDNFDVLVYYEPNGGQFQGQNDTSVVDAFDYDDLEADSEGYYHIKLKEPTDSSRPESPMLTTKNKSFCAGWYAKCEPVLDEEGNHLDADGNVLVEVNGTYYVKGTEEKEESERIISQPAYEYGERFDFENDELKFKREDGKQEIHLYAGWIPYYRFDYFVKNDDGEWTKYQETSVNIGAVKEGTDMDDLNCLWTPVWKDGAMSYTHAYKSNSSYTFPKPKTESTFKAAYLDEACTQEITEMTRHIGTVNLEDATPVNMVQNIYVEFYDYELFRIETEEQLLDHINSAAHYEIYADLDFSGSYSWPGSFTANDFTGEFVAADSDKNVTITGASATTNGGSSYAGLFGNVAAGAKIEGITFKEAKLTVNSTQRRGEYKFGLFAGNIEEGATVQNVTVSGSVGLGELAPNPTYTVNLLACGNNGGVKCGGDGIRLYAFGGRLLGLNGYEYNYSVDTDNTKADANGDVEIAFVTDTTRKLNEQTDIITNWRQQNG